MTTFLEFLVLGLGVGAVYALLAQGIVLIHRGSGVVNFAQAAMALLGAFIYFELTAHGWEFWPASVTAVLAVAVVGGLVYQLVMRRLQKASVLTMIIASLGLLVVIQGVTSLFLGDAAASVNQFLPDNLIRTGGLFIPLPQLLLLGFGILITALLWAFSRFTVIGLALRANGDNPRTVAALGWSPHRLGMLTWTLGGALAAIAGILIAPLTGVSTSDMPLLVIPALAATMIGGLYSFPITLAGAVAIGIGQSEVSQYVHITGFNEALPFLIIAILLTVRGRGLPARGESALRLPALGDGRVILSILLPIIGLLIALILTVFPEDLVSALITTLGWALILLSVVVLLGYAGQLSLAQFGLAGVGAVFAGRLVASAGVPFEVAMLAGIVFAIPVGLVFAVPAIRARGANLAIVTLGLAVTLDAMVFNNSTFIGPINYLSAGNISLFGFSINPGAYLDRYAIFALVVFVLCVLAVAWIRRGRVGRRFIAVRTNERAAAALGINVLGTKLNAFAIAAALASVGGILLEFQYQILDFSGFSAIQSVNAVAYSVVGGVGYLPGTAIGSGLATGGLGSWVLNGLFPNANPIWLSLIGGIIVIVFVVMAPDGLTKIHLQQGRWVLRRFHRLAKTSNLEDDGRALAVHPPIAESRLDVVNLTVRYGAVTAIEGATLSVRTGEIVGLIGPNGAGKTSLIDALTGFTPIAAGEILKDGESITKWPAHKRARAGLSRSFQSLELFESSTVRENLQIASDPTGAEAIRSIRGGSLSSSALAAIDFLQLRHYVDKRVSDLSYGQRRFVAIARAIAIEPSILLLDEPAAGLSDYETQELADVVRRLASKWGLGILVIEHNMSFVMSVADQVVVFDFGRQIATGTPAEVRHDEGVISAYLGAQTSSVQPSAPLDSPLSATSPPATTPDIVRP